MAKRILFFKLGALGDVLMTTPLLSAVKQKYPKAKLDYLVGKSSAVVLKNNPDLDKVFTFPESVFTERNLSAYIRLIQRLRKKKYDIIFVLDKHWSFSLVAKLARIPQRLGFSRDLINFNTYNVNRTPPLHEIHYYLALAKPLRISQTQHPKLVLPLSKKDEEHAKKISKPYIALINSGGDNYAEKGGVRKLPDKLFQALINHYSKTTKVLLIGGPGDKQHYQKFVKRNVKNEAGKHNIHESAAILKYAKLVITTDSGPMHLAGAVNSNTLNVFGPTNPRRKAPPGTKSIWHDQAVYEEAYELNGKLPKGAFFTKITLEKILKKLS